MTAPAPSHESLALLDTWVEDDLLTLHASNNRRLLARRIDAHVAARTAPLEADISCLGTEIFALRAERAAIRAAADAMAEANSPAQFEQAKAAYRALSPEGEGK